MVFVNLCGQTCRGFGDRVAGGGERLRKGISPGHALAGGGGYVPTVEGFCSVLHVTNFVGSDDSDGQGIGRAKGAQEAPRLPALSCAVAATGRTGMTRDTIFLMDKGRLVAQGHYDVLVAENETFRRKTAGT